MGILFYLLEIASLSHVCDGSLLELAHKDGFAALRILKNLTHLDISRAHGPEAGEFSILSHLKLLKHLDVSSCILSKSDMRSLASLKQLQLLRLKCTQLPLCVHICIVSLML